MSTTTNGVAVASVRISYEFDWEWVTIENISTGNSMTLDLKGKGINPKRFTGAWSEVWSFLQNQENGQVVEMDARQLNTYKRMCEFVPPSDAAVKEAKTTIMDVVNNEVGKVSVRTAEERIAGLRKVIEKVNDDVYVIFRYDIPSDVATAKFDHKADHYPCPTLWRHGFRDTLSVWIMPSKQVEHPRIQNLIQGWRDYNNHPERTGKPIKFRTVAISESEMNQIREMAVESLDEYIRELHTALITNIIAADERLKKQQDTFNKDIEEGREVTQKQMDTAESTRDNAVRAMLKRKGEELNSAIASAELFDVTESVDDLLNGLRSALRSQVETFNERAAIRGVKLAPTV